MATLTTTIPALIPELYTAEVTKGYFLNNSLYSIFGDKLPPWAQENGGALRWRLMTDGTDNSAAVAENDSALTASAMSVIKMKVNTQAFAEYVHPSFEAHDFSQDGDDPWAMELNLGAERLRDKAVTAHIATWVAAVGSGGSYAGQTRSSYANALVSTIEDTSEALSLARFKAALVVLSNAEVVVPRNELAIFMGPALASKYGEISNQSTDAVRSIVRMLGQGADGGVGFTMTNDFLTGMNYEGIPVYCLPEFTSGTVLIGAKSDVAVSNPIGVRVTPLGTTMRNTGAVLDMYSQLAVRRPATWYKMTNKS